MELCYASKKMEKICTDAKVARKELGQERACALALRLSQIKASDSVEMMIQYNMGRCHRLEGNRKGEYAVDLGHPYRLIFSVQDGVITIAKIIEIVDYH